jgi:antitoxin ParD1/3/4
MGAIEKISIELSAELAAALRSRAASEDFPSAEAAAEAAVREWLVMSDAEELREAVRQGIDSGPGLPADEVFAELRARYRDR